MARKTDVKQFKKVKNTPQRVMVVQNRHPLFGEPIPFKVLFSKRVENITQAKELEKELAEQFKGTEALCIQHYSL